MLRKVVQVIFKYLLHAGKHTWVYTRMRVLTHSLSNVYMYHVPFLSSLKKVGYHFIIIFRTLSLEKFDRIFFEVFGSRVILITPKTDFSVAPEPALCLAAKPFFFF